MSRRQEPGQPHAFEVKVSGDVDSRTAPMLDVELEALIDADARLLVLDLSDVTFIDSSGLRTIVRARNALLARDGRLTCSGLSAAAAKVLEISGLLEQLRHGATGDQ